MDAILEHKLANARGFGWAVAKLMTMPARAVNAIMPEAAKRGLRTVESNHINKLVERGIEKVVDAAGSGPPVKA